MEKVRSVYWGFGTEGNSLTTDTFEARLHMNGSMDREKKHMRIQKKQHIV